MRFRICVAVVGFSAAMMLALAPVSYGDGSPAETHGGHSPALPFTGLDVVLLGGGGMLLLLAGAAMAHVVGRTRPEDTEAPAGGLARLEAAE